MSGAAEWAAWGALFLSLLLVAFVVGVVVLALRFWAKVEPTVAPMLAMFIAPAPAAFADESTVPVYLPEQGASTAAVYHLPEQDGPPA